MRIRPGCCRCLTGHLSGIFELLFDIQGIRDGLGDKGGRPFRLLEYPALLKKFPDELLRLPTCIFPLLKECGFRTLLFRPLFCNTLNLVEFLYNFQQRLSFSISVFNGLQCGCPQKLDNLTWCKMPVKLT